MKKQHDKTPSMTLLFEIIEKYGLVETRFMLFENDEISCWPDRTNHCIRMLNKKTNIKKIVRSIDDL